MNSETFENLTIPEETTAPCFKLSIDTLLDNKSVQFPDESFLKENNKISNTFRSDLNGVLYVQIENENYLYNADITFTISNNVDTNDLEMEESDTMYICNFVVSTKKEYTFNIPKDSDIIVEFTNNKNSSLNYSFVFVPEYTNEIRSLNDYINEESELNKNIMIEHEQKIEYLESDIDFYKKQYLSLKSAHMIMQKDLEEKSTELKRKSLNYQLLKETYTAVNKNVKELQSKNDMLTIKNEKLSNNYESLKKDINGYINDISDLKNENYKLMDKCSKKSSNNPFDADSDSDNEQGNYHVIENYKNDINRYKGKINSLEIQIGFLKEDIHRKHTKIEDLTDHVEELLSSANKMSGDLENELLYTQNMLSDKSDECFDLKCLNDELTKEIKETCKKKDEMIATYEHEIEYYKKKIESLIGEQKDLEFIISLKEKEIEKMDENPVKHFFDNTFSMKSKTDKLISDQSKTIDILKKDHKNLTSMTENFKNIIRTLKQKIITLENKLSRV